MPPSGVDYASEFLNGYAPEYVCLLSLTDIFQNSIIYIIAFDHY